MSTILHRIFLAIACTGIGFGIWEPVSGQPNARNLFQPPSQELQLPFTIREINDLKVGSCTYYYITEIARECETIFFRTLILEPSKSCSQIHATLQNCISSLWKSCERNETGIELSFAQSTDTNIMEVYSEATYCNDGTLSMPTSKIPDYCSRGYYKEVKKCVQKFHKFFRQNAKDPKVCNEFEEARRCYYKVQDEKCEYNGMLSTLHMAKRKLYRCWNPFCVYNERPSSRSFSAVRSRKRQGIPSDCRVNTACSINQVPWNKSEPHNAQLSKDPSKAKSFSNGEKILAIRSTTPPGGKSSFLKPMNSLVMLALFFFLFAFLQSS
ncbi:uncharacterized protein LOC143460431 isoform X1 [Clavelina lepadiformis]|uniref:uncharacterized protein LOC143460431 isoform X1 n=1 Tax=Clavelina lepadiformis TaxID=159417 RepID=UPI004041BF0E